MSTLERPAADQAARSTALEFRAITKRYGDNVAVDAIDLTVRRGELLTLLGPSGSGKTTLLKMIAGFEVPTEGAIVLDGRDISTLPPGKRNIGMVFQQYALFPHLSVLENVAYGLRFRGVDKRERLRKAAEFLDLMRLSQFGDRSPTTLSGGQQQRVAIARALAIEPALLLMDEPLGALDRQLRLEMEQEIRRLHHELDTTLVYVTHDQEEALTLSDRIAVMREGRLAGLGAPRELYERPPNAFVARFFGGSNVFSADIVSRDGDTTRLRCFGHEVDVPTGGEAPERPVVVVNPASFELGAPPAGAVPVQATVHDAVFLGETVQLGCTLESGEPITVRSPVGAAAGVATDGIVRLFVRPERFLVLDDS